MKEIEKKIKLTKEEIYYLKTLLKGGIEITNSISQVDIFKNILSKLKDKEQ